MTPKMSEEDYTKLVLQKSEANHIWINKLVYLYPTDESKLKLADMILDKLRCKSAQVPSSGITSESELMRDLAELTPMLYLQINWS